MVDEYVLYKEKCREYAEANDAKYQREGKGDWAKTWYDENRNEISLQLLGDICKDKRVLSVGGRQWRERELMDAIDAREKVVTDIIGQPEWDVIEVDACDLPYPNGSFDVLICRELIEHVLDDEKLLNEAWRVLAEGGYMLITTPNAFGSTVDGVVHVRGYSPQYLLETLAGHAFEIVKKAGNMPYIFFTFARTNKQGNIGVFRDFWNIGKIVKNYEDLYYICSQMFVLCRKRTENAVIKGSA